MELSPPGSAVVNAAGSVHNTMMHTSIFRYGIFCYFINFLGDIIAAWAIYILLKPVSVHLSMLTAWMRIIYTIISLVSLMNLLTVLHLLSTHTYLKAFNTEQLQVQ